MSNLDGRIVQAYCRAWESRFGPVDLDVTPLLDALARDGLEDPWALPEAKESQVIRKFWEAGIPPEDIEQALMAGLGR